MLDKLEQVDIKDRYKRIGQQQQQQVLKHIENTGLKCGLCSSQNFEVIDHIFDIEPGTNGDKFIVGGQRLLFPHVMIICTKCMTVYHLNANGLGVKPISVEGGKNDQS
jgi:hypothetical protein